MITTVSIIIVSLSFSLINHFIGLNKVLSNNVASELEKLYNLSDKDLVFVIENMNIDNYSKEAYKKVLEAQEFVKKQNYPKAIELYIQILNMHPKWVKVKEALIEAYFHINHYNNLTKEALELIEIEPDNAVALDFLYKINLKNKNTELTIKYLNEIIEKTNADLTRQLELAELYFQDGQFHNSLNLYIQIVQQTNNIDAVKKVFEIFKLFKNLDEQLAWCNKVLTAEPNNVRFLIELTDIYIQKQNYENALDCAHKLKNLTLDNSVQIDIKIAGIYHNLKKHKYAIEILEDILSKDAYNLTARKLLAKIYKDLGEFEKMIDEAKEVVYSTLKEEKLAESKEFCAEILTDYAYSLYEKGNNVQALDVLSLVLAEKETDRAYCLISKIHFKIKNIEESTIYIKKAISINPEVAEYYYILATIRLEDKRIVEAKENYQKAIILNKTYKDAYFGLALAYIQEQNYKNALVNLSECININKLDYKSYINLALVYEKINDIQSALKNYKISQKIRIDKKIQTKIEKIEKNLNIGG